MCLNSGGESRVIVGHSCIADGKILWIVPGMSCHTDEIIFHDNKIWMASGEDGLLIVDFDGNIIFRDRIGHAQRVSVGNYRPDLAGYETCAVTYWRNPSIISLYDSDFNKLCECEREAGGNMITPVNWTGDGRDLILFSASRKYGGLFDGELDLAVPFPDDSHPELCCDAVDILSENRDDIIAWDAERMYIYSGDDDTRVSDCPAPRKYPNHNGSNYRGEYSFYDEKEVII